MDADQVNCGFKTLVIAPNVLLQLMAAAVEDNGMQQLVNAKFVKQLHVLLVTLGFRIHAVANVVKWQFVWLVEFGIKLHAIVKDAQSQLRDAQVAKNGMLQHVLVKNV